MQRWSNRHQLRLITEMSITPLLNLVLVLLLLLLFMIASPLVQGGHAPAGPGSKEDTAPGDIAKLTVDKGRTLALNGHAVALADLKSALVPLLKDRPDTGVLVQIHRDQPVQVLVDLMDSLRQAGVQKTAVETVEK